MKPFKVIEVKDDETWDQRDPKLKINGLRDKMNNYISPLEC